MIEDELKLRSLREQERKERKRPMFVLTVLAPDPFSNHPINVRPPSFRLTLNTRQLSSRASAACCKE